MADIRIETKKAPAAIGPYGKITQYIQPFMFPDV